MESSLAIADDAEVGITCTIHRHDKGLPLNVVVGRADRIIDLKAAASQIRQDLDVRDILFYRMGMEEVLCDQVAVSDLLVVPSEPTVVLFMCPGTACSVQHPVHDALRQHVGSGCSLSSNRGQIATNWWARGHEHVPTDVMRAPCAGTRPRALKQH
jgi:hypothetical protein